MSKLQPKVYRDGGEVVKGKISANILVGVLVFENNKITITKGNFDHKKWRII